MAVKKYTFLFTLADGTTHRIPIEIPVGEPGGYYIPVLRQVSDTEVEVSYDPSNPDMPSVKPIVLKIPAGGNSGGNVDLTGVVKSVNGQTPDENGNVEIAVSGGGGLSATASALLIGILKNAVYTADQSANITALEVELAMGGGSGSGGSGGGEASAYTVVCTIGDATIDNNASAVAAGGSYTATITPNKGYELNTVTVLMGGVDVTATVYVDGVINIESVTGNVIIKVTTVEASDVLYQLSAPTTFDGTNAIDTNVKLFDEDKDWSIVVDLSIASPMSAISESYIYRIVNTVGNTTLLGLSCYSNGCRYTLNENHVVIRDMVWVGEKAGNTHKGVITHTAGTTVAVVNCYQTNIKGQVETATDKEIIASSYPQDDTTIMLCPIGGGGAVNVNDFKIYNRVLTDDEITAYLGV